MTPLERKYLRLNVVWKIKNILKTIGMLKSVAEATDELSKNEATRKQASQLIGQGIEDTDEAIKTLVDLKKSLEKFVRRI